MNKFKIAISLALVGFLFLLGCSSDTDSTTADNTVKSITINSSTMTDGTAKQLTATVLPSNAANKAVTWSVSDTSIAIVSESGILTPVSNGTVIVKATANDGSGISIEKTITISGVKGPPVAVSSITINGSNITDSKPQQLSITFSPADATNKIITWAVSDSKIATISTTGLLTPKLDGTIKVTATSNDGSGKVAELQIVISNMTYATTVRSESILIWQRSNGGWGKIAMPDLNDYNLVQTDAQKATAASTKNNTDTTIDNGHVTTELRWLLEDYKKTGNPKYLAAAEKAIDFLFTAQYDNGGWPQYYPDKSSYRHQITYNDDAIVKVMNVMWDISKGKNNLELVDAKYIPMAVASFNKGIDIILKTQITINGKKTVWCAQHDEVTLLPALARAYELPSLSGSESVGITRTLMLVEQPSAAVKQAIKDAVDWFNSAKIVGYATAQVPLPGSPDGFDVVVVSSPGNIMWARFYDLNTGLPFFCGRDGIKKATLAEIEIERRSGYAWYGTWPSTIISSEYTAWKAKNGL